jgi:DnaJ-domain-containing protein 1
MSENRRAKRHRRKEERANEKADRDSNVDLGGEEHAWWAGRDELDSNKVPSGHSKHKPAEEEPKRNTFEEYFSTESLFDWTGGSEAGIFDETDPYVVLGLPPSAGWDEISAAHRRLAKLHHPDRLVNATEEQRENSDRRIRELNIAYMELRRRKGR